MGKLDAGLDDTMCVLRISELQQAEGDSSLSAIDKSNGLKIQPAIHCWMSGAGWMSSALELVKAKVVNHNPYSP